MSIIEQDLHAYDPKHWTLIPLRPKSKRPQDYEWSTRAYDTRNTIAYCIEHQCNAGVRLTDEQLVIDVDLRRDGDKGFDALCQDLQIDLSSYPHVRTGSGGSHYYMSKPGDVPVLDTLEAEAYGGIEFKSKGRQVVSAGSVHPDTNTCYEWVVPLGVKLPTVPDSLLNLIRRPQISALSGGGQYTQEELARALSALDPSNFRDHDAWFTLMAACHHATNGDARSEFVEWCTSDPAYADHGEIVGRRWDSLHRERPQGKVATYRTLNKILADAGKANQQVAGDTSDDFNDDEWMDKANWSGLTDDAIETLESMNTKFMSVTEKGKFRILYEEHDPVNNRDCWTRMDVGDFLWSNCNHRVERDTSGMDGRASKSIPIGKAWIEWPDRKKIKGIVFAPGREWKDYLNLWTGFAYDGKACGRGGEWSYLRELIFEVLAQGDAEIDAYIINWIAYMMRYPATRAEVALVFKGGRGVGKGTLGNVLCKLVGRHAMPIASPELLTGRFTSHLQDLIFLFADEAIRPYDKAAESRFKALITEPKLAFEGKGRDAVVGDNYLHMMLASNELWVIPAGLDERRFCCSECSAKWQGCQHKFDDLHDQLNANGDSGYKRMMFDLVSRHPLPEGWTPRAVPVTKALIDQKIRNLPPIQNFCFNALCSGDWPMTFRRGPWITDAIRFFAEDFNVEFRDWCRKSNINAGGMGRSSARLLLREIEDLFPNARTYLREPVEPDDAVRASPSDNRAPVIELPSLPECRANFERLLGTIYEWERKQDDFG